MAGPEPTITKDRLYDFLINKLEMSKADLDLLQTNRYTFLECMEDAYTTHIPFQSLSWTAVPLAERKAPTAEEALEDVLSGLGGFCWTLNGAFYIMLKELGYDVYPIVGNDNNGNMPHMLIVVRNVVKEGDQYLLDMGCVSGGHKTITLDFDAESPTYRLRKKTIKWIKRDDTYIRCELLSPTAKQRCPVIEGDWGLVMFCTLKPLTLDDVRKSFEKETLDDKQYNPYNTLRTILLVNPSLDQFATLKEYTLTIESKHGSVIEKIVLENVEDVVAAVEKYFPAVASDIVRASYRIWHLYDKHTHQYPPAM